MMKWIAVDIDGTLSDCSHRVALIPNWEAFHGKCLEDKPYENVCQLIHTLGMFYGIVVVTGRTENFKDETVEWLSRQAINFDELLMRPESDYSQDVDLKWKLLCNWAGGEEQLKEQIVAVFEDRDRVVEMYRNKGITCLQPRIGDY